MSDFVGALQLLPYERPAADHNDHDGDDRADDPASPATCPSRRPFALGPDHRRRRRPPGRRPGRRLLSSPLRGRWWGSHLGLHAAWRIFRCGVSAPMKPEVLVVVVVFTVFSLRVPEEASGRARARRKSRALNVSFNGRARTVRGVRACIGLSTRLAEQGAVNADIPRYCAYSSSGGSGRPGCALVAANGSV
jgi:hypothetical protein